MPHFDRFDIALAYYHFSWIVFNVGSPKETLALLRYQKGKITQLERIRYKPGLGDMKLSNMSLNARMIYRGLVHKHLGIRTTTTGR